MKIIPIKEVEITDFEIEIGRELVAKERVLSNAYLKSLGKFYVNFPGGDIKEGKMLCSKSGDGNTIDEALKNYCKQISNQTMVFNAFSDERKEIKIPKLIHTKLLNK